MVRPVPEATLDRVAQLIADGVSIPKAAQQAGIGNATLYTKIGDSDAIRQWATARATPEVREQATIRERVARAIAEKGPFESVGDLRDAIAEPRELIPFQSVVGSVWSLQKQGEVAVTQTSHTPHTKGHGPSDGSLKNIRALPALYSRLGLPEAQKAKTNGHADRQPQPAYRGPRKLGTHDPTDFRVQPKVAPGGPVEVVQPAPERLHQNERPEPPEYPLLLALRAKADRARRARESVELIERAADLLSNDDGARARLLDEGAALLSAHDLTPIEDEYLKYAEAHS